MTEQAHELDIYDRPPAPGKDYIIKFQVRNGPLWRAMRMRGYRTITEFARACGLDSATSLSRYFTLRCAPLRKGGNWTPTALKMAAILNLPPESLFPEQHIERALVRASGEAEVSADEIRALIAPPAEADPETKLIEGQLTDKIQELLHTLPERTRYILEQRYGLDDGNVHTLEEISDTLHLSRDRVRQIELDGVRQLKHPAKRAKLAEVTDLADDRPIRSRFESQRIQERERYAELAEQRRQARARQDAEEFVQHERRAKEAFEEVEADRMREAARRQHAEFRRMDPTAHETSTAWRPTSPDDERFPVPAPGRMQVYYGCHVFVRVEDGPKLTTRFPARLRFQQTKDGISHFVTIDGNPLIVEQQWNRP